MVKFISYDGKYPNLCSGVLTLNINGQIVKFGNSYRFKEEDPEIEYYSIFWYSGGEVGFDNFPRDEYIETKGWDFEYEDFPEKYVKYFDEICELFNENVNWGCCGGCL